MYTYHSFLIHSSADGHPGYFHVLAIVNSCCDEHWGTCVSFNSGFLRVYAQQWNCWVIWQLMKVKKESEKVGLKLNIQKMKIMASGPITSWGNRWGNSGNSDKLYFWGAPRSLQTVTAAMKLNDFCSLEEKL